MKKTCIMGVMMAVLSGVAVAQPVQWRVEDGGNGHWYQVLPFFDLEEIVTLSNLYANAEVDYLEHGYPDSPASLWQPTLSFGGGTASVHFVQLGSERENRFVSDLVKSSGFTRCFIGLHQARFLETPPVELEPAGGWQWDSGDALVYANWTPGQPDNAGGTENCAVMDATSGQWSDWGLGHEGAPDAMVIEYAAPVGPTIRFVSSLALNHRLCRYIPWPIADPAGPCGAVGRTVFAAHNGDTIQLGATVDRPNEYATAFQGIQHGIISAVWSKDGEVIGDAATVPTFPGYSYCTVLPHADNPWDGGVCEAPLPQPCVAVDRTITFILAGRTTGIYELAVTNVFGLTTVATFDVSIACIGDFNADGGIDGADVSLFFEIWEAGGDAADVNADGGVDNADVQTFFDHWENGC